MKKIKFAIFIILISSLYFNCVEKKAGGNIENEDKYLAELKKKISKTISVKAVEKKNFIYTDKKIGKNGSHTKIDSSHIVISLDNGDSISFRNIIIENDETGNEKYIYKGYEPLSKLHWVVKQLYEENKNLLISQASGKISEISNTPHINNTGTFIFSKQNETFLMLDDSSPGFQIYKNNNGLIHLIEDVKLQNYFIVGGGWISNNKLIIELGQIEQLMNHSKIDVKCYEMQIPQ